MEIQQQDEDVSLLNIVVGKITSCKIHPTCRNLVISEISIGGTKNIQVVTKITEISEIPISFTEKIIGNKVAVISNVQYVYIQGELSEGILVGAVPSATTTTTTSSVATATTTTITSTSDNDFVFEFVAPPGDASLGEKIFISGIKSKNSDKKLTNHVLKKVKKRITIGNSVVLYDGIPLKTSGGVCCVKNLRSSRIHF